MHLLVHLAILAGAFILMAVIVPNVRLKSAGTAVVCALVFTLINFVLGWFLRFMLVVGTLGLAFVALNYLTNVVILWITDKAIDDFEIKRPSGLFWGALLLTIANAVAMRL